MCPLVAVAAFGFAPLSEAAFPSAPVRNMADLSPEALEPPTQWDQVVDAVKTPESLYGALTILLCVLVLSAFGWWRDAGVDGPSRWKNLYLLVFPVAVVALAFSGGVVLTGPGSLGAAASPTGRSGGAPRHCGPC